MDSLPQRENQSGLRTRGFYKKSSRDRPVVTIVTVVRNSENELEKTIRNVLSQSYENIEYIIIDGDSDDGSRDVINRFDSCIDYWCSEADQGPYYAMNKAIEQASGKWINFMNAGDHFHHPHVIRDVFSNYPVEADFIYGYHYWKLAENNLVFRKADDFDKIWGKLKTGKITIPWLQSIPCHQSLFAKTEIMKATRFNTRFRIAADHNFMFASYHKGHNFYNCRKAIPVYASGGISAQNHIRCIREQWRIIKTYKKGFNVDKFFLTLIKKIYVSQNKTLSTFSKRWDKLMGFIFKNRRRVR